MSEQKQLHSTVYCCHLHGGDCFPFPNTGYPTIQGRFVPEADYVAFHANAMSARDTIERLTAENAALKKEAERGKRALYSLASYDPKLADYLRTDAAIKDK